MLDHAALRNYLDAGGSLVEGFEHQEILDAVLVVGAVKNGARFDDEDDENEDADG